MLIDTLIYLSGATRPVAHMVCCLFIIGQKKLKRLVLVSRGPFSPNLLCLIRKKNRIYSTCHHSGNLRGCTLVPLGSSH